MTFSLRLSSLEKRLNPPGSSAAAIEQQPCGICGRQFAKYTCPTCNTPYCSLTCFRSEAHSQCTEPFYRQALEDEIKSGPSRTAEEKRAMLEMLKRFEEQSAEQDEAGGSDEDEEGDEEEGGGLAAKLEGLDLDQADPEELWNALSPEQQAEFTRLLHNPDSEPARALLATASREDIILPWWEATPEDDEEGETSSVGRRYGLPPALVAVPEALVQAQKGRQGPPLVYNLLAIAMMYGYVTRHMGRSPLSHSSGTPAPETDEAQAETAALILQTLPFLADRRSTLVFSSVDSALTDLWSRLPRQDASHALFAVLLRDAAVLLQPHKVAELDQDQAGSNSPSKSIQKPIQQSSGESSSESAPVATKGLAAHPHRTTLLMLSDLHTLLSQNKPAALKLQYYAAHVLSLPTTLLAEVATQAEQASAQQELEEQHATPALRPHLGQGEALRGLSLAGAAGRRGGEEEERGGAVIGGR
ncbi:hypothetical protein CALCODRAFT_484464 [Calocera cornea HHB12733]|uniref:HIT-type domain-containing protein n=1 Tax=Calocera cornea HHB12733 TaxID=1353952 RepID=A0A165EYU0_9BASI|nr:hypothetical protein CALCODRAFT_484464 [Calocera cornea HHB12733]